MPQSVRFDKQLKLNEKKINERMRQMERQGLKTPAYEALQAQLEMLGIKSTSSGGRRLPETGKGTFNQLEQLNKIVNNFLSQRTSTVKGYKDYRNDVWGASKEKYQLNELGISKDTWFGIWKNLANKESDRAFGSEVYIAIVYAYSKQNGITLDESEYKIADLIGAIDSFSDVKSAIENVGLSYEEFSAALDEVGK